MYFFKSWIKSKFSGKGSDSDRGPCPRQARSPLKCIQVDESYQVCNGLTGIKRDALLRLCHVIEMQLVCGEDENQKIRTIIGISLEHFMWKTHSYFISNRRNTYPSILPNDKGGYKLSLTRSGTRCSFHTEYEHRTVFLDRALTAGIVNWTVQIAYGSAGDDFYLGASLSSRIGLFDRKWLGINGSCAFNFYQCGDGKLRSRLTGVKGWHEDKVPPDETVVPQHAVVSAETNLVLCTLSFFVNGERVPRAITGLQKPVHLGITGVNTASFVSLSFRNLTSSTSSSLACRFYELSS